MINLKTLCLSFLLSVLIISYSSAQDKPLPTPSPAPAVEAKKFESKEGNFSIDIFQAPIWTRILESEQGDKKDKKEVDPGKHFFWQFENTAYTIMYSEFYENELSKAFNEMNSGLRIGIGRGGGQIISEKEISFGKYQGREFSISLSNGFKSIYRNYLVGNFGYLLTATYADEESKKEAVKVLDSFKLLTEKN